MRVASLGATGLVGAMAAAVAAGAGLAGCRRAHDVELCGVKLALDQVVVSPRLIS